MTSVTSQAQQYSQRKLRKLSHCTKHDEPIINDLCCLRLIGLTVILSLELSFFTIMGYYVNTTYYLTNALAAFEVCSFSRFRNIERVPKLLK